MEKVRPTGRVREHTWGLSVLRQEKQGTGQGMHRMRQATEHGDKIQYERDRRCSGR